MVKLEFLYVPYGISLCPLWNFFMSLMEFLYAPCGISLCPINLSAIDFIKFSLFSNQVSNQVFNQVFNQAINQGN